MFKSTGLAKMLAGRRKFFRGPHVRHLCLKAMMTSLENEHCHNFTTFFPFSVKFSDVNQTYLIMFF